MAVLRRLSGVALRIRSTFGPSGLLEREVGVSRAHALKAGYTAEGTTGVYWVSLVDAEDLLLEEKADEQKARRESRRGERLPAARAAVAVSDLTAEELRLLDMSQKEWGIFRARAGTPAAAAAAAPEGPN